MSNVPLPEPAFSLRWERGEHKVSPPMDDCDCYTADQMHAYAASVSAAKDAEIAGLRADLIKSLADNKALRERVRVLEDARPEPDCRTCKHMMHRHFRITCGAEPCTNGNRYQTLPPVRLWVSHATSASS